MGGALDFLLKVARVDIYSLFRQLVPWVHYSVAEEIVSYFSSGVLLLNLEGVTLELPFWLTEKKSLSDLYKSCMYLYVSAMSSWLGLSSREVNLVF